VLAAQLQGTQEVTERFLGELLAEKGVAKAVAVIGVVGPHFDGLAEGGGRFIELVELTEQHAKVIMRLRSAGEHEARLQLEDRFGVFALTRQGEGQLEARFGIFWPQTDGVAEAGKGVVEPALIAEERAEVGGGIGVFWVEPTRLPQGGDGFVEPALAAEEEAKSVERLGIIAT
jgi:hypothetical protein